MDIVTLVGLIFGVGTVLGAMVLKHIPFTALINPAAIVVIFGGTIAAVLVATPMSDLKNFGRLFGVLFGKDRYLKKTDVIPQMISYAAMARRDGLLSLEAAIRTETDPFFIRCLQLLADGASAQAIEEILYADIEVMQERHAGNAQIFAQAGTYAPTLGVLGAVLGLVAALSDLSDTAKLSAAISAAFIATILGIFTGYVLWNPMANRLRRKSNLEVQVKTMMIQATCDIAQGKNLQLIQQNLMSNLTAADQKKVNLPGKS